MNLGRKSCYQQACFFFLFITSNTQKSQQKKPYNFFAAPRKHIEFLGGINIFETGTDLKRELSFCHKLKFIIPNSSKIDGVNLTEFTD